MDLIERYPGVRRHPWELARAAFVRQALEPAGMLASASRLLDIGSGDGWLAGQLRPHMQPRSEVVCWDANYTEADRRALATDHPGVTFAAAKPDGVFDLLLLLDVLEHVENDLEFLSSAVVGLAAPGAHFLVTVPAWQSLFSQRDRYLGHYRRYSLARARTLIRQSGLCVLGDGGLFHALLPMRAASVVYERLRGSNAGPGVNPVEWHGGPAVTSVIAGVLTAEARVSLFLGRLGVGVPGLSYWALCRKEP